MSVRQSSYHIYSDTDLVKLIGSGDHKAFREIYERYWGILFIHAMKMLRDEDDVKDILQELFTALWNKSAELEFNTSVSAYLYKAVRNKVFNLMGHQKIKDKYAASMSRFMEQGEWITDEQVRTNELKRLIEAEIALLPPKMREVFELSRNQHFSHKEIAEKLGISDKTVRKQINNAIRILKMKFNLPAGILIVLMCR